LLLDRQAWYRSPHPIAVRMLVCFKDDRRQDIDNRVKPFLDALKEGHLIQDDRQVKQLEVREGPHMKRPCIIATVQEILPDRNGNLAWVRGA
jgi:Holliday junction resolvase RusA-like endonuclease